MTTRIAVIHRAAQCGVMGQPSVPPGLLTTFATTVAVMLSGCLLAFVVLGFVTSPHFWILAAVFAPGTGIAWHLVRWLYADDRRRAGR